MPELLDQLYWHTELTVADVARRVGLPARRLHQHVTPISAGVACYRCGDALTFSSRSQRDGERLRCSGCGSSRRNPSHSSRRRSGNPPLGVVGGSMILVRESERDPGWAIESCVDALADAGVPWDGCSLVVLPDGDANPDAVVNALAASEPGVVAIDSLLDLAGSQTERLQVLFALTRTGWRVLAAHDVRADQPMTARSSRRPRGL